MKVISCKRNADVKLHLNLQVNLNLVTNVTNAHTRNITKKRYMGHKKLIMKMCMYYSSIRKYGENCINQCVHSQNIVKSIFQNTLKIIR